MTLGASRSICTSSCSDKTSKLTSLAAPAESTKGGIEAPDVRWRLSARISSYVESIRI